MTKKTGVSLSKRTKPSKKPVPTLKKSNPQKKSKAHHEEHHAAKPILKPKGELVFPFTAIVGQEEMKLCLILNIINPRIGGVLVMGHRGTGKSTTVRALADVLPEIERVQNDPYNRSLKEFTHENPSAKHPHLEKIPVPVVDLPLGATEDRVCGTIDIEQALTKGAKAFEPGLLAKANRGFLYIDEVNLLDDHLVDVLLDSAASGRNTVEREGISIQHPARFVLVGSGNPEEGELRPQLLDRFGLHARINTINDVAKRVEIVKRRRSFDENPKEFLKEWEPEQKALQAKIEKAKSMVDSVTMPDELLSKIALLCMNLGIDGHRGELTVMRTASSHAAYEGRSEATVEDILAVSTAALRHRLRRDPLETMDAGEKVERELKKIFGGVAESFPNP